MSFRLEDVKGLDKKADLLREAGIDTVEKLASADIESLTHIKGVGKTTAQKLITNAKDLIGGSQVAPQETEVKKGAIEVPKKEDAELKKLEERRRKLEGKKVEKGDFVLVKITGRTQKGTIFRVSSVDDAKKAGIYDEEKEKQGYYTPEFVIIGKPGFLNEGLTETIETMNFFEIKSVRIPPTKAFGKRDPQKIERIGISKFRRLNENKNPEIGQEFVKKGTGQRGVVTRIDQGKAIVDYNHPLAGQNVDYNIEIIDKIENFDEKIKFFMISKGIPENSISEFVITHNQDTKDLEIIIPKMFLFQNLTYLKFGLAMDLQSHLSEEINNVKYIEIFEKMPLPPEPAESVKEKVEKFEKEHEHDDSKS
jgi:peptidylprolyl isomerase